MKLLHGLLLLFICMTSIYCLHLSSDKENHKASFYRPSHKGISYYGRHYLNHRSQEYIQQVKQDNKKKIEEFNTKNKEALQKADGQLVKGGNSYVMGKTKFLQFTQDEFVHLFTGLKKDSGSHEHLKVDVHKYGYHESSIPEQSTHSVNQDIFDHFFVRRLYSTLSHQTQLLNSHASTVTSHNQDDEDEDQDQDSNSDKNQDQDEYEDDEDWQFQDPFEIDDSQINDLYGNVNSEDSWGWDWKQLDSDYYDSEEDYDDQDYDGYWNEWQDDHWGYDEEESDEEKEEDKSPWWKKWDENAQQNEGNDDWWYDDEWDEGEDDQQTDDDQEEDDEDNQDEDEQTDEQHKQIEIKAHSQQQIKLNHNQKGSGFKPYAKNAVEVNWAKQGATTHIKNQGVCGSCWTYSAVGVVEAYFLIKGKGVTDLSEQQIVDCQKDSCYGCDGGQQNKGLQFATKSGLVAQSKYPYRGVQQKCAQKTGPHKIPNTYRVSGRVKIEEALRKGPITAAVYVDQGFQFYEKGVFDKCQVGEPNHAVVLVGYTKDYWIIRNSWGADWGEKGHIRIKKNQNKNNACAIQNDAYAISS